MAMSVAQRPGRGMVQVRVKKKPLPNNLVAKHSRNANGAGPHKSKEQKLRDKAKEEYEKEIEDAYRDHTGWF